MASWIADYGLPFLDGLDTEQRLIDGLEETGVLPGLTEPQAVIVRAILYTKTNRTDEAKALLAELKKNARIPGFVNTIDLISRRLGFEGV